MSKKNATNASIFSVFLMITIFTLLRAGPSWAIYTGLFYTATITIFWSMWEYTHKKLTETTGAEK